LGAEPDWSFDLHKLAAWLKQLPSPWVSSRGMPAVRAKCCSDATHLTILESADAAGFGSPEYMAHVFRTQLRKTPSHYRCQIPRKQWSAPL
jgi:AraC-like DNA-binding protein